MKLERCLTGSPEEMLTAQRAIDKALGYPRKGLRVGGGRHVPMPETWDGTGECPPGWTATASAPVLDKDGAAYLAITGLEMDLIDPENLTKLTTPEIQTVAKVAQSQLYDLKAIVNEAAVTKEAQALAEAEGIDLGTKVALGIAAAAGLFEIVSNLIN
jgi:hypothetical protein